MITPRRIGGYLVEARLGAGGMGAVYGVVHEATGARRALKVLTERADPDAAARFAREGEALAAVDDHPNVVRVHEAGTVEGQRYLVMELCTGGDLKARLRDGPLPPEEAARVVLEVARGVAHVHARGIVHRDLKPENVMFDEAGRARVTDFGLARVAGAQALTATGTLLGTPAYMAPEQADGRAVDERADVWALGGILLTALTGRPPYAGATPVNVLFKLASEDPRWPSVDRPDTPPALEAIVRRAMVRDPSRRYPSAAAMAEDLERYLAGGAVAARGGRRAVVALAAGALVVVGLAPVVFTRPWSAEQADAPAAVASAVPSSGATDAPAAETPAADPVAPTGEEASAPQLKMLSSIDLPDVGTLAFVSERRVVAGRAKDEGLFLIDTSTGTTAQITTLRSVRSVGVASGVLFVGNDRGRDRHFLDTFRLLDDRLEPIESYELAQQVSQLAVHGGDVPRVAFVVGEDRVLSIDPSGTTPPTEWLPLDGRPTYTRIAFSPDGRRLARVQNEAPTYRLDVFEGGQRVGPQALLVASRSLAFAATGELLIGFEQGLLGRVRAGQEHVDLLISPNAGGPGFTPHAHEGGRDRRRLPSRPPVGLDPLARAPAGLVARPRWHLAGARVGADRGARPRPAGQGVCPRRLARRPAPGRCLGAAPHGVGVRVRRTGQCSGSMGITSPCRRAVSIAIS